MAPGARIVLVEADSQSLADLMTAVATAGSQPGVSVVSMSWGFTEGLSVFASDETYYDSFFNVPGVTFVASTGDYGAANPEYPAYSPNVVAVGGTSLSLNSDHSYATETGWGYHSDSVGAFIGSGGGISLYQSEPSYQHRVQSTGGRTTPDVALIADPGTGAWIADPYNLSGDNPFQVVGGTSLSAPAWAGLVALANQGRAAAEQPLLNSDSPVETHQALYMLPQADYNMIAGGTNGYHANTGYNLVTGLGTPMADRLVFDLIAYQGADTTYSGPTVGPLQDAALTNTGAIEGSIVNVFSVFNSFIVTGSGHRSLAHSPAQFRSSLPKASPDRSIHFSVRSSDTAWPAASALVMTPAFGVAGGTSAPVNASAGQRTAQNGSAPPAAPNIVRPEGLAVPGSSLPNASLVDALLSDPVQVRSLGKSVRKLAWTS
jgi:hypothetical protein